MKHHFYSTEDRKYLAELLGYFPASPPVGLDDAQNLIRNRCQSWDPFTITDTIIDKGGKETFYNILPIMPASFHRAMFKDILSNAGEYRKIGDPNEGIVEFGLPIKKLSDANLSANGRFAGFSPDRIEPCLTDAFGLLEMQCADPFENAACFYQRFIRIHPFYDGNGRIGRFMVDAYLYSHGMYIDWARMKQTTRWIRQLNYCHRKSGNDDLIHAYRIAIRWWCYHLNKFRRMVIQE